jgi:hypothetical protein
LPWPAFPQASAIPVVRGQIPAAEPTTLKIPAPEELGIRLGGSEQRQDRLDWDQLRQRLDRLGASSFQLEKRGNGFYFECKLPTGEVEGVGTTEAEAVCAALDRVKK